MKPKDIMQFPGLKNAKNQPLIKAESQLKRTLTGEDYETNK